MSENHDESLGDVSIDTTPQLDPTTYNVDDLIRGIRPTQRSVKIHARGDVLARLDQLAGVIESAPEGADVDALIDEFDTLKKTFEDGEWWTVQRRSQDWVATFRKSTAKRLDITLDTDGDPTGDTAEQDRRTLLLHQVAAQIIAPTGVTADQLAAIEDQNEGELTKLIVAVTVVNSTLAESAGVLTKDFSQRRSTNRATRRSSKR